MSATYQLDLFDLSQTQTIEKPKHVASLGSILDTLNSIPRINSGGCGIAALAIYRWCKANNVPVSDRPFIFLWRDDDEWEARNNDQHLFNGEIDNVEAPSHVAIELADGLYDTEGLEGSRLFQRCTCKQEYKLNEYELLNVINRTEEWNFTFNRSRNIPIIEIALGIDLSDVKQ